MTFLYLLGIGSIILIVVVTIRLYQKNKSIVDAQENAVKFSPKKLNFILAYIFYFLSLVIPFLVAVRIIGGTDLFIRILVVEFIVGCFTSIGAYPYYTIVASKKSINGPTLWGWMWRRLDLDIAWLDKEKILKRNPGRRLGIVIFYTRSGEKMLTLGLDNSQIKQILALASEASAVK